VIREIRRVAALVGTSSLSRGTFKQHSHLSVSTIKNRFGSWNSAINAAGLTPSPNSGHGPTYTDEELLLEIIRLTHELGKRPALTEMNAIGRFSVQPYRSRWRTWSDALRAAYARFGNPLNDGSSVFAPAQPVSEPSNPVPPPTETIRRVPDRGHRRVQYGEPLDFRGLRHAPVNEQGVVYLFGMVSRELGFLIESLRTAFPDCEGKYCVDEKKQLWEQVLIEFEFRSSNFKEHGHDPNGCDFVVCWIHDWDDCPINVIELRSHIPHLPK
jgi:hypothetical protein